MGRPVCAVVGIGPGNGEAFARRFASEGYAVALVSRSTELSEAIAADLDSPAKAYACDATDFAALRTTAATIAADLGTPDVVIWNVGSGEWGDIDKLDAEDFDRGFRTNVTGAVAALKPWLPAMRERGSGNIVFVGATASLRGKPFTTAFAASKAAQRSLAQSLARHLGPDGIHVSLLILDGVVRTDLPEEKPHLHPSAIADAAVMVVGQPRSAWTFELDLRPFNETW